jgi:hypothetical protein
MRNQPFAFRLGRHLHCPCGLGNPGGPACGTDYATRGGGDVGAVQPGWALGSHCFKGLYCASVGRDHRPSCGRADEAWENSPFGAVQSGRPTSVNWLMGSYGAAMGCGDRQTIKRADEAWRRGQFGTVQSGCKRILTASWGDQAARLWDAATGKLLGEPMKHKGELTSAHLAPTAAG